MELKNAMEVFVMVVDAGGFTAAGRLLEMPTPTVSRQIARLEDHLGVRLLQRTTRRVTPTEAGERYYARVKEVVHQIREAEEDVRDLEQRPRGRLRVSLPAPGAPTPIMETLIALYARRYKEVTVEATFTNRYVDLVEEGYDVAIRAGQLTDSSLRVRRLSSTVHKLMASPGYFARRGTPSSHRDLENHTLLVYRMERGPVSWPLLAGGSFPVTSRVLTNNMRMCIQGAVIGLGLAVLPVSMVADEIASGALQYVLEEEVGVRSTLNVLYPHNRHLSAKVRAFVDFTVDYMRNNPLESVQSVGPRK